MIYPYITLLNVFTIILEWMLIQMTPQFSCNEILAINSDELTLNGVHLTVFNCGQKDAVPYCITLPKGNAFSIRGDMKRLKANLKEIYSFPHKKVTENMSLKSKKMYHRRRLEMEDVLEVGHFFKFVNYK